ncbi:hypothetical protein L1987_81409 [Smallanthus sonchifolius]|uniref:Uncharacterized protein n=1 Tax=Smallanthus sonchifolius TaxID=185202 RepID=A0ACB8YQC7_9ASTR|nr:hypothetical protein L1987_81409 [Smallanthus sonchifolius]
MRAPLSKCESPSCFFKFIKPDLKSQLSIPISFRKYIKSRRNNKTAILKRGSQKWFVKIIDCAFSEALKKIPKEKDTIPDDNHHAYFLGTLKSAYWKYRLFFPINFTRSNGLRNREMILRNGQSQMSWTVDFKICSRSRSCIGRGWHDFYIANGLKVGDHFKFELIQTGIKTIAVFYNLSTKQSESHGTVGTHSFVGTLNEYSNSRKRLYIPRKLALENGLKGGELVLKYVENEGSWTVKLSSCLGRYYYIQGGLKGFCTANGLGKGDNVKFELIQNGKKPIAIISKNEDASEQSTVLR